MAIIGVPYHLDEYLPDFDPPVTVQTEVAHRLPPGAVWQRMAHLDEEVADEVAAMTRRPEPPLVLSGDCTTSLGTVAGLQRAGMEPSVVWFDAHGDVNVPETSPSGYLGGMPLRMLAGEGDPTVADHIGLRALPEQQLVLVDARDLDPPEAEYLASAQLRRLAVDELSAGDIPDGPVYLHVDFDVVDPAELPGLAFPAPGGPSMGAVAAAMRTVIATGRVAAVGLACTWKPGSGAAAHARPLVDEVLAGPG